MNNEQRYRETFVASLHLTETVDVETLQYNTIPEWDSIGHMELIAGLETAFDIMMEMDDIIDLSSYEKGKEILAAQYGVEF